MELEFARNALKEMALLPLGEGGDVRRLLCLCVSRVDVVFTALPRIPLPAAGDQRSPPQDSHQHSEAQGEAEPATVSGEGEGLHAPHQEIMSD